MPSSVLPPTEFEFVLPKGFVDETGTVHQQGKMRLATAGDELRLQRDRQVQENPVYGDLVMLAQVITQLGTLTDISPQVLENLFALDLSYLREFYNRINQSNQAEIPTQCPECQHTFVVEFALAGEF
ncbi:MAG: phage tail assembly protein [Cyanobacteria bacterium P01_H01_bin.121]